MRALATQSMPEETILRPPSSRRAPTTGMRCPVHVRTGSLSFMSQILTVQSNDPDATTSPTAGAREQWGAARPRGRGARAPSLTPPITTLLQSIALTCPWCPCRQPTCCPLTLRAPARPCQDARCPPLWDEQPAASSPDAR